MSSPETLAAFNKRLDALEAALGLPGSGESKSNNDAARIAQLERTLTRTQYRVAHLEAAYDRLVQEIYNSSKKA